MSFLRGSANYVWCTTSVLGKGATGAVFQVSWKLFFNIYPHETSKHFLFFDTRKIDVNWHWAKAWWYSFQFGPIFHPMWFEFCLCHYAYSQKCVTGWHVMGCRESTNIMARLWQSRLSTSWATCDRRKSRWESLRWVQAGTVGTGIFVDNWPHTRPCCHALVGPIMSLVLQVLEKVKHENIVKLLAIEEEQEGRGKVRSLSYSFAPALWSSTEFFQIMSELLTMELPCNVFSPRYMQSVKWCGTSIYYHWSWNKVQRPE